MTLLFEIVAAKLAKTNGIGINGSLPWRLSSDLRLFHEITTSGRADSDVENVVIMGRKTWDSLPKSARPLPIRINVVISQTIAYNEKEPVLIFPTLTTALDALAEWHRVFIIGGARLYEEALNHPRCGDLYLTDVTCAADPPECDTYFPDIPEDKFVLCDSMVKTWTEGDYQLELQVWTRKEKIKN